MLATEPDLAVEILAEATWCARDAADAGLLRSCVDRLRSMPAGRTPMVDGLVGFAELLCGDIAGAVEPMRLAFIATRDGEDAPRLERLSAGFMGLLIGEDESASRCSTAWSRSCALAEPSGWLPYAQEPLVLAQLVTGRLRDADSNVTEAIALAEELGQDLEVAVLSASSAWLAAARGDRAVAERLAGGVLEDSRRHGTAAAQATWALGLVELMAGDPRGALERLEKCCEGSPGRDVMLRAIPDHVEAAVRAGEADRAHRFLPVLTDWATYSKSPVAAALLLRCEALLDAGGDAGQRFEESPGGRVCGPYDRARTRLVFGEWLRRHRRPSAAKEQLVAAYEAFDRISAQGWLPRVRAELTALGEAAPGDAADHRRRAHPAGAAGGAARRPGTEQPRDRRRALPQPAHGRPPPLQGLPEAGGQTAGGAGTARPVTAPQHQSFDRCGRPARVPSLGGMGKVIVRNQVTVNGAFEAPSPEEWLELDADSTDAGLEQLVLADAMLLGRKTYEGLAAVWPHLGEDPSMGHMAERVNAMPKYVASRTLAGPLEWNATLIEGDVVRAVPALKEKHAGQPDRLRLRRAGAHARPGRAWSTSSGSRSIRTCGRPGRGSWTASARSGSSWSRPRRIDPVSSGCATGRPRHERRGSWEGRSCTRRSRLTATSGGWTVRSARSSTGSGPATSPGSGTVPELRTTQATKDFIEAVYTPEIGAMVVGRYVFDQTNGWDGEAVAGDHVFVVTHEPPTDWEYADTAPFTFVTDGVESASPRRARSPATGSWMSQPVTSAGRRYASA